MRRVSAEFKSALLHARTCTLARSYLPAARSSSGQFRDAASFETGRALWRVGHAGGGDGSGGKREGSGDRQGQGTVRDWGLVNLAAAGTMAVLLGEEPHIKCDSTHQMRIGLNDSDTVEKVRVSQPQAKSTPGSIRDAACKGRSDGGSHCRHRWTIRNLPPATRRSVYRIRVL
jgi:hypothetical protein